MTVCVFASSSGKIDQRYMRAAADLGQLLAANMINVIYGGGGIGLMGALADSIIENGGSITGVIPSFMNDEGWGHPHVREMIVTRDMGERKKEMFTKADAVVALPGGVGTLEELTRAEASKLIESLKHIIGRRFGEP